MLARMDSILYRGRQAYRWENDALRLTITRQGGHIAELLDKRSNINPLWAPPWPTIEPSTYSPETHPEYGPGAEAKLLSGILGHNLCIDLFGDPSPQEAAAGYTTHGEASLLAYDASLNVVLPLSQLRVQRQIALEGRSIHITEEVENLLPFDRSIAWQQHVTLGPPFLERGITRIEAPVLRSFDMQTEEFSWTDRTFTQKAQSSNYHSNLLSDGWVEAHNPRLGLGIRYEWNLQDFPWLGIWEENCDRDFAPWNSETLTWGMEFGASPYSETRFRRATRGLMSGAPTAVWLPAHSTRKITYSARFFDLL
jgi:hypothetical protein